MRTATFTLAVLGTVLAAPVGPASAEAPAPRTRYVYLGVEQALIKLGDELLPTLGLDLRASVHRWLGVRAGYHTFRGPDVGGLVYLRRGPITPYLTARWAPTVAGGMTGVGVELGDRTLLVTAEGGAAFAADEPAEVVGSLGVGARF